MNKRMWVAVPVLAAAVGGCGHMHAGSVAAVSHSAQAAAAASQGAVAVQDALASCLPSGTVVDQGFLTQLAVSRAARVKLAAECRIPKTTAVYPATVRDKSPNRTAFGEAVLASAGNAWMAGHFKTAAGRAEWADKVFPVIMAAFRVK